MVSVSGNSGTAAQLTPSDVPAQLLALELHRPRVRGTAVGGLAQGVTDRGDGEDTAAGGDKRVASAEPSPRVKDVDVRGLVGQVKHRPGDRRLWVPGRGDDSRDRMPRLPLDRGDPGKRVADSDAHDEVEQAAAHQGKDRLGFRIAEPAVELDHLR